MKLQQKCFAPIIILVGIGILAGIALMIPLPYYQSGTQVNCGSVNGYSPACSVNSGWKLGPSIWQKIFPQYVKQPTIKEDSQKVITESPAPSGAGEIANPDLIGANWKTYTNDTYKFSLKYPPSYSIEEKSGIDTKLFSIINFISLKLVFLNFKFCIVIFIPEPTSSSFNSISSKSSLSK